MVVLFSGVGWWCAALLCGDARTGGAGFILVAGPLVRGLLRPCCPGGGGAGDDRAKDGRRLVVVDAWRGAHNFFCFVGWAGGEGSAVGIVLGRPAHEQKLQ